ncbi:peptidoglycan-binding protein [Streptomyces sp. NPDC059385]|uniref:peptidoglycan-binding protein n=1 Tax=Streptomyces sp. NPDC059385 TaxID=3346817 RepID=UPI00369CCEAA
MSSELVVGGPGVDDPHGTAGESGAGSGLSRRRRWVAVMAVGAVLAASAGVGASTVIKSPAQAAAEAGPPPADVLTAVVERRVLTETLVLRGMVTADQTIPVTPSVDAGKGAARPVVTKLAVAAGDTVAAGRVLLEVSGRPVFALEGGLPVYRDLKPGAEGDDVAQLQSALGRTGHGTGSDRRGVFGAGTKSALTAFYASIGYDPLPAQADGGAAVKAAEETVTSARRALEDARETLRRNSGATPGTQPAGGKAATGGPSTSDLGKAVTRAQEDLDKAQEALSKARAADGPMLPAGEVVFLKAFPARVASVTVKVGSAVSGPVLTMSAGELVVEGRLRQHQKGMVRAQQKVRILAELSGTTVTGKVLSVADTMQSGKSEATDKNTEGEGASPPGREGYLVVIRSDSPLDPGLSGQDVRLTVEAASTEGAALVVPGTAISAGADGRTTVTVVTANGTQRRVEVRPGTAGDGFVEVVPVEPGALREGEAVVTGVDVRTAQ